MQTDTTCAAAAVVIGVEDYAVLPDVPYAERDAAAFASFVQRTLGCPAPAVVGADRATILAALTMAGQAAGARTVWVYFAGNAANVGHPVLLAADAPLDPASWDAHGVAVAEVRSLAKAGGAHLVLLVDAALDGRSRTGAELAGGRRFPAPTATPIGSGSVEWWASTPGELAGPLDLAQHGAFTWAALGALRGWADGVRSARDARVSADEADRWVADALQELGVDQHPQLRGDRLRTLSLANEPAPPLDPLRWAPEPAPVEVAAPTTGEIVVSLSVDGQLVVDGIPRVLSGRSAAVPVAPGRHLVEVRTAEGTPLTGLHVDVADGQRVELEYRSRQLLLR